MGKKMVRPCYQHRHTSAANRPILSHTDIAWSEYHGRMDLSMAKIKVPPDKAALPNPVAFRVQMHAVRLMHPDRERGTTFCGGKRLRGCHKQYTTG